MALRHEHMRADWLAYVERRLEPAARARLDLHLDECARCRERVAALSPIVESLAAMTAALSALPSRSRNHWPAVWSRVQRPARPAVRLGPRLTMPISLVAVALSVAVVWPGTMVGRAGAVTAGVVETPRAALQTPQAIVARGGLANPAPDSSATVDHLAVPETPAPAQTPAPEAGG